MKLNKKVLNNESQAMMAQKLEKAFINKSISKLQHDVYQFLLKVPSGKITTYKMIANEVKCNSPRAIGQALRKNPFAPEVPCHRVVRTDLSLGGFSGSADNRTVEKKMKLLIAEGISFKKTADQCSDAIVLKKFVWTST